MGQKVHPIGFRLGYNKNWLSRWFSKKEYPAFVLQDDQLRKYVKKKLYHAGLSKIEIELATQLERRVAFRRAMKRTVALSRKFGAEGIKVACAGRLAGAEIARSEWYRDGRVPLHTLRADIDFGYATAKTTYGIIGVRVWIFKGEILDERGK